MTDENAPARETIPVTESLSLRAVDEGVVSENGK